MQAVGAVQYVSIQISAKAVMADTRNNRGWRIRLMGFPSLQVLAGGLCSHYQGTQNQNLMGEASERIRQTALGVLGGANRVALEQWPSATAEDWDGRGLMPRPVTTIGDLDISTFDQGRGALLQMVRNTTVKKDLATFFALRSFGKDSFLTDGPEFLNEVKGVAMALADLEQT
jgi:hypothetical protein